jgi:glycosyltransferase involved in cell wall biosynthesis
MRESMNHSIDMKRKLRIMFVSTTYPADSKDWRGRFIANLLDSLSRVKDIQLNVWAPPGVLPKNVIDSTPSTESEWLKAVMTQGGIAHFLRTERTRAASSICRLLVYLRRAYRRSTKTDIFHINWLQNALPLFGSKTPAVISVLGSDYKLLAFKGVPFVLRSVLKQRKCILAPNAEWMAPELKRLFGDISEIRPIPFGVDQRWFQVTRPPVANNPMQWIAVSRITQKKIGPLLEWGKDIFRDQHELHLIGPMQENTILPEWVIYHGPASADELCEIWFPKAAGLVTLSQHAEGRPQVILEAMAAGLPVVASDISAHIDVIRHQKTGWLVSSAVALKEATISLSNIETNHTIGKEARHWIKENIGTWHDCANRYIQAYTDLIEANK